jgi:hypothetical protein
MRKLKNEEFGIGVLRLSTEVHFEGLMWVPSMSAVLMA